MTQKILITSALPYANGPLHFGHIAGAYLPADCYARYERLKKNEVLYICGSDEYGVAITLSADLAGHTPKEHVDIFHHVNKDFFAKLHISFDHYSRTTWEGHVAPTQEFFRDLLANGYIEERVTDQLYSEKDNKFLADRYVEGECPRCGFANARGDECQSCGASYEATELKKPRSKMTQSPLVLKATKHWFLLLDKFKDQLTTWINTKKWKPNVINFIKGYIDHLHARAITRDSNWGIPVPLPNSEGKVLYVWFDAPIGYISATKEWATLSGNSLAWENYWKNPETKLVNFIGKDNIPFHASIFPAMVMGQNQPYKLVDELPANEFYKLEGKQFSKSDGWYIDLEEFFKNYTPDQIRYVIAANAPETADSEFTWKDFQQRCNSELLGKYGNLANRVLVFLQNQCQGQVPALGQLEDIDQEFLKNVQRLVQEAGLAYSSFKVRQASQVIMELAQLGNAYFDNKHPWKDAKDPSIRSRMETTIHCCLQSLKALALISLPIIPNVAEQLAQMIGYSNKTFFDLGWDQIQKEGLPIGHTLPKPAILFQRVEDEAIQQELAKLNQMAAAAKAKENAKEKVLAPLKETISIDEVRQLDLRVGKVLEAERVPKSKKLLKLLVDIGLENRTIVSGIGESYKPEEVRGLFVIVVANLKPATLMGVTSQGMLLAGDKTGGIQILSGEGLEPGTQIS